MMDGWDWVWGTLMMIVFWGGLAAVVVVAVRAFGDRNRTRDEVPHAAAILEARYARGEISEDEFRHRKSVLRSESPETRNDPPSVAV